MNSGTGIQELMAAETRASQIVAEARIGQFNMVWLRLGGMGDVVSMIPYYYVKWQCSSVHALSIATPRQDIASPRPYGLNAVYLCNKIMLIRLSLSSYFYSSW